MKTLLSCLLLFAVVSFAVAQQPPDPPPIRTVTVSSLLTGPAAPRPDGCTCVDCKCGLVLSFAAFRDRIKRTGETGTLYVDTPIRNGSHYGLVGATWGVSAESTGFTAGVWLCSRDEGNGKMYGTPSGTYPDRVFSTSQAPPPFQGVGYQFPGGPFRQFVQPLFSGCTGPNCQRQ